MSNQIKNGEQAADGAAVLVACAEIKSYLEKCAGIGEQSISVKEFEELPGRLHVFFEYDGDYECVVKSEKEEITMIAESYNCRISLIETIAF